MLCMSGHGILQYTLVLFGQEAFSYLKTRSYLIHLGPTLSKVIPSSSIASCNAEVTKVLKQAKCSVTGADLNILGRGFLTTASGLLISQLSLMATVGFYHSLI